MAKLHPDLLAIQRAIYDSYDFTYSPALQEDENKQYGACSFMLNRLQVQFRVAKITPIKAGYFVTLWKRSEEGLAVPYDVSDDIDYLVVSCRNNSSFGHFAFTKEVLRDKRILSCNREGGKRGIRVYPPWDCPESKQALKSQQWQLNYFIDTSEVNSGDRKKVLLLYGKRGMR